MKTGNKGPRKVAADGERKTTTFDRIVGRAKDNWVIAVILVLTSTIVGIASRDRRSWKDSRHVAVDILVELTHDPTLSSESDAY
jgi:hypothetical protein